MNRLYRSLASVLLLATLNHPLSTSHAQGTAFTYQGRLNSGGAVANGSYDVAFRLFATNITGSAIAGPVTNAAVAVTNGLFTTTVDFGNQFPGAARWLELAVRTNGSGTFTTLSPRQVLSATPYAITANSASNLLGTLPAAQLSGSIPAATISGTIPLAQLPSGVITNGASDVNFTGSFTGNGVNVTNVNAASLNGISSAGFWNTNGNAGANGAFIGTTDNLPLQFRVNGSPVLLLRPNATSPNIIGGFSGNIASNGVVGAFIGGGGSSGNLNVVGKNFGAVLGGNANLSGGVAALAMGQQNQARGDNSTALGFNNSAFGYAAVSLGEENYAGGPRAMALGYQNFALDTGAFAAGFGCTANSEGSTAMGEGSSATGLFATALGNSTANGKGALAAGYLANSCTTARLCGPTTQPPASFLPPVPTNF